MKLKVKKYPTHSFLNAILICLICWHMDFFEKFICNSTLSSVMKDGGPLLSQDHILIQFYPVHILTIYFSTSKININLSSTSFFPKEGSFHLLRTTKFSHICVKPNGKYLHFSHLLVLYFFTLYITRAFILSLLTLYPAVTALKNSLSLTITDNTLITVYY